jgi:hypothetical protein
MIQETHHANTRTHLASGDSDRCRSNPRVFRGAQSNANFRAVSECFNITTALECAVALRYRPLAFRIGRLGRAMEIMKTLTTKVIRVTPSKPYPHDDAGLPPFQGHELDL